MRRDVFNMMVGVLVALVFGLAGCGGGGSGDSSNNNITAANAGPSQNVLVGSLVTLDGSQSTAADGNLITYQWSMVSKPVGSAATIINPTVVNSTFTPDLPGQYIIKLIVTEDLYYRLDDKSVTSEATVTITASVANAPPVANAGTPQSVSTGAVVTLDGSASSDANGDSLTYAWAFTSMPGGSSAALSSASVVNPTFTADLAGAYVLNLVVSDGLLNSAPATVTVTATDPKRLNVTYTARNGLSVTLTSFTMVDTGGYYQYTATYTQTNNTSAPIDEGQLKLYFTNSAAQPQFGFFNALFPGDTISRSYTFNVLYTEDPWILEFDHDNFFAAVPVPGSIQWVIPIPN